MSTRVKALTPTSGNAYRLAPHWAGLLGLIVFLCIIELVVGTGLVSRTIVARPSDALRGIFSGDNGSELFTGFLITFSLTAVAMIIELLVAIPVGIFLFMRRDFGFAYASWLAALFAAPIFLLYPLFMVIFGRSLLTLVVMGFLSGVVPLIIQVEQGFLGVSKTLINVGRSFDVTRWQHFTKIMIPAAGPSVFTGFRLALMYTLINIIAVEYLVDIGGLGRIVADRYGRFDIAGTYSAIIAVTVISALFNWVIGVIERWVRPV